jgi:hypothetical protein
MARPVNTLDRYRNVIQRNEYAAKISSNSKPTVSITSSTQQPFVNESILFTPSSPGWTCDPAATYTWEVDGVGQVSDPGGTITYTFSTPGPHNIRLTVNSNEYGSNIVDDPLCVSYKYTGNINATFSNSSGQPVSTTINCNSGLRVIGLDFPTAPQGCAFVVSWTKNGQSWGQEPSINVYGVAVSFGMPPIVDTYVATIVMDCSAYKDCTQRDFQAFSGTATLIVTNVYVSGCQ